MTDEQRKWEAVADKHLTDGNIEAANVAWRMADLAEAKERFACEDCYETVETAKTSLCPHCGGWLK